jgi:hypothetical protein
MTLRTTCSGLRGEFSLFHLFWIEVFRGGFLVPKATRPAPATPPNAFRRPRNDDRHAGDEWDAPPEGKSRVILRAAMAFLGYSRQK